MSYWYLVWKEKRGGNCLTQFPSVVAHMIDTMFMTHRLRQFLISVWNAIKLGNSCLTMWFYLHKQGERSAAISLADKMIESLKFQAALVNVLPVVLSFCKSWLTISISFSLVITGSGL
jgi:hypothetical protein